MAGQTTWNKATVPAGTDPWNAVPDVKKSLDTAGLVFSVANATERNGLAALAPGGVLPVPTLVFQSDIGTYLSWNGTRWGVTAKTELGSDYVTPSSIADVTYTTISTVSVTSFGGSIRLSYAGVMENANSGANRTADVQWLIDGSTAFGGVTYQMFLNSGVSTAPMAVALTRKTALAAGTHTIALQTRASLAGAVRNVLFSQVVEELAI